MLLRFFQEFFFRNSSKIDSLLPVCHLFNAVCPWTKCSVPLPFLAGNCACYLYSHWVRKFLHRWRPGPASQSLVYGREGCPAWIVDQSPMSPMHDVDGGPLLVSSLIIFKIVNERNTLRGVEVRPIKLKSNLEHKKTNLK